MSTSDDDFEHLVRAVRRAERGPSKADHAAVRGAIGAALATSVATAGVASASKAGLLAKGAIWMNVALPLVVGALFGAGVSVTALVVSSSVPETDRGVAPGSSRLATSATSVPRADDSSVARPATLEASSAPNAPAARKVATRSSPSLTARVVDDEPPATADPLVPGRRGLAEIQRALRDGEPGRALSLLDAQERVHRAGALAEERAAARVFALCSLGRAQEAANAVQEFVRRFPGSLLAERVRASCAGQSAGGVRPIAE